MFWVPASHAMLISLVSLTPGQNPYTGGVPSLINGGVGFNEYGGGLSPRDGGAGVYMPVSGTAKIGLLVELELSQSSLEPVPDQITFIFVFFDDALDQWGPGEWADDPTSVELEAVKKTVLNSDGDPWRSAGYSFGMGQWVGVGGSDPTAPYINDFHGIYDDDRNVANPVPGPGNTFGLPNSTQIAFEIVVHGRQEGEARVLIPGRDPYGDIITEFDTGTMDGSGTDYLTYTYAPTGSDEPYTWMPRNGRTKKNAFPILVIPEPGSLTLLMVGGIALHRRRRTA